MTRYKIKTAFTLIELLVVIAIIGILSGLIIVGMSSSVNSARIAKAQIFSASLRDSLLMNIISEWKFEDLTTAQEGQSIKDAWNSNNGTLYTGSDGLNKLMSGSSCLYGQCISLDGSDYVSIPYATNLDFGVGNFSVSMWIKGGNQGGGEHIIIRKDNESQSPRRFWGLVATTNTVLFQVYDSAQASPFVQTGTSVIGDNNWHLLTGVRSGDNIYLYVDGSLSSSASGCAAWILTNTAGNLVIGKYQVAAGAYYTGVFDDIRIFNAAIPASKIKEEYYAGINRLLSKEIYNNK